MEHLTFNELRKVGFQFLSKKIALQFFWNEQISTGHFVSPSIILTVFRLSKLEFQYFYIMFF